MQRFNFLKTQLEQEAACTIEGFTLTNANYEKAVELLTERFGQRHRCTHARMQSLLQQPAPRVEYTHLVLRQDGNARRKF